jgi:hypothetical protein
MAGVGAHQGAAGSGIDRRGIRDLSLVGSTISTGAVDAMSFLGLGKVFSAFVTGDIAFLGFLVFPSGTSPVQRSSSSPPRAFTTTT